MKVLVVGAGGRFAPIADLLIDRGHEVRVTSRDPDSPAAVRLAALGAQIVPADYEDAGSLTAAARRVDAVFAGGTAPGPGRGSSSTASASSARTRSPFLTEIPSGGVYTAPFG